MSMILFELLVGLAIIGLLAFAGIFFTQRRKRSAQPTSTMAEQPGAAEDGSLKPRNKANMDQPQEEFIAPESAHGEASESRK